MTEKMRVSANSIIRSVAETSATPASSRDEGPTGAVIGGECTISPLRPLPTLDAVALAAAAGWAAALPAAAWVATRPHLGGAAYAAAAVIYTIGRFVCHQRPERSFHLWGAPLPVCARCAGIYAGAALGALIFAVRGALSARGSWDAGRLRRVLIASAVPTLATVLVEWTTGAVPANWIRAAAGAPMGAAIAWVVVSARAPGVN
jgi:uncharacterized membrane protein